VVSEKKFKKFLKVSVVLSQLCDQHNMYLITYLLIV